MNLPYYSLEFKYVKLITFEKKTSLQFWFFVWFIGILTSINLVRPFIMIATKWFILDIIIQLSKFAISTYKWLNQHTLINDC